MARCRELGVTESGPGYDGGITDTKRSIVESLVSASPGYAVFFQEEVSEIQTVARAIQAEV